MMSRCAKELLACAMAALLLGACGSSGGGGEPPRPPAPVAPPPPPPEPTFEERLADLATADMNACRAQTPGFEALGGWLKNDERENGRVIGGSRVWLHEGGDFEAVPAPAPEAHAANVRATFEACAVRLGAKYLRSDDEVANEIDLLNTDDPEHGVLISLSAYTPRDGGLEWFKRLDDASDGPDVMAVWAAGNSGGKPAHLRDVQAARAAELTGTEYYQSLNKALESGNVANARWIMVGGYSGEG